MGRRRGRCRGRARLRNPTRSMSYSPTWRTTLASRSNSRSCSPFRNIIDRQQLSPISRLRSPGKISKSGSCPLLCSSEKLYELRRRASSCENDTRKNVFHNQLQMKRFSRSLSCDSFRLITSPTYPRQNRSRSASLGSNSIRSRSGSLWSSSIRSRSVSLDFDYSDSPGFLSSRSVSRSCSRSRSPESLSYVTSRKWRRSISRSRSRSRSISRSRSRSRIISRKRRRRLRMSRSRSISMRRSRSRSISRRRSRSRSISRRRSRSRSISRRRSRSRSISRRRIRSRSLPRRRSRCISRPRSRSRSISRRRGRRRFRTSRSRSISIPRIPRSLSWRRSRSRSLPWRRSRSRSISLRRSRSRSVSLRRSRSRSISLSWNRSRSRSPRRRRKTNRRKARRRRFTRRRRVSRSRSRSISQSRLAHKSNKKEATVVDIDKNVTDFFFANASTDDHIKAQTQNRTRYIACMGLLHQKGVELRQQVRVQALAASWARNDFRMSREFLHDRDRYGMVEVLKALQILDTGRRIRKGEKSLKRLQMAKGKVARNKINKLKCKINTLQKLKPKQGSATGAVCKHIRNWTKTLGKDELERFALHLPTEPWRRLAELCHFNPAEDFPNLPWFLSYCFGKSAPGGTIVHTCEDLNKRNINDKIKTCDIPYAHCRQFKQYLNVESKIKIATSEPRLDTVLWYYEDIECRQVDEIIMQRLDTGDTPDLPIGKLMDRLLTLKELARGFRNGRRVAKKYKIPFMKTLLGLAESKLQDVKLKLESPVVVLGDRSSSMSIAVSTSSVIAGILCSICSADLVVFNHSCKRPRKVPTNVDEVLKLAMKTEANGSTNPSSALMPYYKQKKIVKTFIVVTDEDENGGNFADLFEKYHKEVYPARLVFISFLRQHEKGFMCEQLRKKGFTPLQFVLNTDRPDLTKIEKLFGILASEGKSFTEELSTVESQIKGHILQGDLCKS